MVEAKSWLGEWKVLAEGINDFVVYGLTIYEPNGRFYLEASMPFANLRSAFNLQMIKGSIHVVGIDYKTQKSVTLTNCIISNSTFSLGSGGNHFKITPNILIEDFEYVSNDSLFFNSLLLEYTGINKWFKSLYDVKINIDDNTEEFQVSYKNSEDIIVTVEEGLLLNISPNYSTKGEASYETGFFITEKINIKFSSSNNYKLSALNKYGEHLRRLFQLLTYQPCFVKLCNIGSDIDECNNAIYYSQSNNKFFNNYSYREDYLVRFEDITNFSQVIRKWFELKKSDAYTYITWVSSKHLFINTPFSEEVFLENVRALEVYHKVKFPQKKKKDEEQFPLRLRLKALILELKTKVYEVDFNNFILDEDHFVEVLLANRNYLTHYSEKYSNSEYVLTVPQLYGYATKVRIILITLLLDDVDINPSKVFGYFMARR